ncbi:MAG: hypothetical protein ACO3JL_05635 [Myxococcota bacterium]
MVPAFFVSFWLLTPTQAHPATGADPAAVRVVVEELGNVGLRISDAQALATDVVSGLRARMGSDAVVFEGTLSGSLKMKKLVGQAVESQIQDDQIAYLQAATTTAPFRVRVRFGKKAGAHWIALSCRARADPPERILEETRVQGSTFAKAREAMQERLAGFCRIADPPGVVPASSPQKSDRKKKRQQWVLPPRRP